MLPVGSSSFEQEEGWDPAHPPLGAGSRPMSVQFIDDSLKDLHNALKHPLSTYDTHARRYVALSSNSGLANRETGSFHSTDTVMDDSDELMQSQALVQAAMPMTFWESIFQVSLDRFRTLWPDEPQDRDRSGYNHSIRKKTTWEDIYAQLQKAREFYDGDAKGLWGRHAKYLNKKRRSFIDHTTPVARQAVRFVPQMEYTTPVIAAVQVLVDAFETSSRVRTTMTTGLDQKDLEQKFSSIELFLATFPKDIAIREASIELIAATLKAIEDVIGFFLESNTRKALSATFRGKDYQKKALESIEQIEVRSDQLLEAAQKSHMSETKHKLDAVLNATALSFLGQRAMSEKVSSVLQKLDQRECSDAFLRNTLMEFLNEAQEQKRRELEEKQRESEEKRRLTDHITLLTEQVEKLRETTISAPSSVSSSPNHLALPPAMPFSPFGNFSALVQPNPSVYSPRNIDYLKAPSWDPSAWHLDIQQPSPSSTHSRSASPAQFDIPALRSLVTRFECIEEADLNAILENKEQSIPFREKRKADLIVSTRQFYDWMVSSKSSELLVHGEFRRTRSVSEPISALSVFCATLTQTFRKAGQQQIALVFFCGSYIERDDRHRGPSAMICSFIAQLGKLWSFNTTKLQSSDSNALSHMDVDTMVKEGNLPKLCELFGRLVQLLPKQVTLICIIDGISHYETDEFEEGLLEVLGYLLSMTRNLDLAAAIKILASSPTTTDLVQTRFRDDDSSFISLAEIRDLGQGLGSMQLEISSDDDSRNSDDLDDTDSEANDEAV